MNYISHFWIDHIPGKPNYNFGLALPDMIGAAQRGWRPSQAKETDFLMHESAEIWQGFQKHLAADAIFHSTPFFTVNTKYIRQVLEQEQLNFPGARMFFVAHILLEMLLDRIIINGDKAVADLFYTHLDGVADRHLAHFFEVVKTQVPPRFYEFLQRFREHRFLFTYTDDEKLLYALNRIMGRAGQQAFDNSMLGRFSKALSVIEPKLQSEYKDLPRQMRAVRPSKDKLW